MTAYRLLWALLLLLTYTLLCVTVWRRHRRQAETKAAQAAALLPATQDAADSAAPLLVLHASQTGRAEELAWQTARALHLAGKPVRVASLGDVDLAELAATPLALFIASTYGEGDPPDDAAAFATDAMSTPATLDTLQFGVLALGDSSYQSYCGFGKTLDAWLRASGATPQFDRIDVDREDPAAVETWRRQLSHIAGAVDLDLDGDAPFTPWRLRARRQLNPGSVGGGVFHLELEPQDGVLPHWEAGDLVQIRLDGSGAPREYTIASLPTHGRIELMVRLCRRSDGSEGAVSGHLCRVLDPGDFISLRVRTHRAFRIERNQRRPLVLVGNGTGLAGLRAHWKAAADRHAPPAWLVYGERQRARDAHYRDEIDHALQAGVLAHADLAFSRDAAGAPTASKTRYVQHLLGQQADRLFDWMMTRDAALYVCGSLDGMAGAVDSLLRSQFGATAVDGWIRQGRYRRDVY